MYITDKTTSKVVTHNTMETYYTFMTTDRNQCTSYQFCASASNAAGEGEKSGQVEGYFLQGTRIYTAQKFRASVPGLHAQLLSLAVRKWGKAWTDLSRDACHS